MTELEGPVRVVDLGLEETDASGEGYGCVVVLISGCGEGGATVAQEGYIVGAHVCYVIVVAVAEEGGVVACRCAR